MALRRGRGVSVIEYPTGMNQNGDPSQAWIKVKPDGRIDVFSGTSDIGNGAKTIQSQIAAEAVGVPFDWVTFDNSNTDSSPVCTGTFASRATFVAGNAVRKAAQEVRYQLLEVAAKKLEISAEDLEIEDGQVYVKGTPSITVDLAEIAATAVYEHGVLIAATGTQLKPHTEIIDPETGQVDSAPHSAISYAGCVAQVEVDDETGAVRVVAMTQCYDVGRAINPGLVEGQIQGGAMMGLGLGVLESSYPYYPLPDHRGSEFSSYTTPSPRDMPEVMTILIENPSEEGPYGAKGIGEMANNAQPPTIAAAVYDAVGVWITEIPITPEAVLKALDRKDSGDLRVSREGKLIAFDEHLSVNTVASGISWTA